MRTLKMRHFDVQLIGGIDAARGPDRRDAHRRGQDAGRDAAAYLNALTGEGVHVVTVNEYLAQRDADWMGPIFRFLGLTRRRHQERAELRREARRLRLRHHLRHQQRIRLRLPARQPRLQARGPRAARPVVRHRRRSRLHPHRRGAHAAHHLRPRRREHRAVPAHQPARAAAQAPAGRGRARRLLGRREDEAGAHHRRGPRARRGADGRGRPAARGREPLRPGEHPPDASPERGAARACALQARRRIHRAQRRSDHRRRVHRPHHAGPALVRWPAPGRRSEGRRAGARGEPDRRLDHLPELLPPLQEALGHDRHGRHRSAGVHADLRPRSGRDPDPPADDPQGQPGLRLPHAGRQVQGDHRGHPRLREARAAGAGRHHVHRDLRVAVRAC